MVGERMAIEKVDEIENLLKKIVKTKKQKILASALFDFNKTDWNYFAMGVTKNFLKRCSYILRRIDKQNIYDLYCWDLNKGAMMKDRIVHILEYLSYISKDNEKYFKKYEAVTSFYGLKGKEARDRFKRYHKSLEDFDYIKFIKSKW